MQLVYHLCSPSRSNSCPQKYTNLANFCIHKHLLWKTNNTYMAFETGPSPHSITDYTHNLVTVCFSRQKFVKFAKLFRYFQSTIVYKNLKLSVNNSCPGSPVVLVKVLLAKGLTGKAIGLCPPVGLEYRSPHQLGKVHDECV